MGFSVRGHICIRRKAKDGEPGAAGKSIRTTVWETGKQYYCGDTQVDGVYPLDIVSDKAMSIGVSGVNFYMCKTSHTSSANIPLTNTAYWTKLNNLKPVVTYLILAEAIKANYIDVADLAASSAFIQNLIVNKLKVKDGNDNVLLYAGDAVYPLLCGSDVANNAVTKIKADGELQTSKIKATGGSLEELTTQRLRNPFGTITDSFTPIDDDNVVSDTLGAGSYRYAYSLDWTVKSSGRRQTIIGAVAITAPSGKYFYENGRKYTEFNSSYECSEMIGYGDDTTFYGWIVVRRTLFSTNYNFGRDLTPLAMGRVSGGSGSASFAICKYINKGNAKVGSNEVMAVAHSGTTGHYYLYCPRSWFVNANYIGVDLTGYGYVSGSSTSPAMASVAEITATTRSGYNVWRIEVVVADDATPNDGSFYFKLYNMAQWDD